jgi:hypothetical protein
MIIKKFNQNKHYFNLNPEHAVFCSQSCVSRSCLECIVVLSGLARQQDIQLRQLFLLLIGAGQTCSAASGGG